MRSPLFNAVSSNNPAAAAALINLNADYRMRNSDGLTAFDLIREMDEWLKCECFDDKMKRVLKSRHLNLLMIIMKILLFFFFNKGYEYKQTRNLVRYVTEKVKPDFSMESKLSRRHKVLTNLLNQHKSLMQAPQRSELFLLSPSTRRPLCVDSFQHLKF